MNEDTAKLISIPVAACLSTFLLWLLYLASPPKLEGHWHVFNADGTRPSSEAYIETIDFRTDGTATLNLSPVGYAGLVGGIGRREKRMYFGGECLSLNFKYHLKKDTLLLRQLNYDQADTPFFALRCQEGCCDKQTDFFLGDNVDIDLPVAQKHHTLDTFKSSSHWMHIKVGKPKQEYQLVYGSEPRIQLGSYLYDTLELDLSLWVERHQIKLPEHRRKETQPLLFVDRNVPMIQLSHFMQSLYELGFSHPYFVLRSAKTNQDFRLRVKRVSVQDFNHFPNMHFTIEQYLQFSKCGTNF